MIQKKYYKLVRVSYEDSGYMYIKNISNETGVFKLIKTGSPNTRDLQYSTDGVNWTPYNFTDLEQIPVAPQAHIYFRGNNNGSFNNGDENNCYSFNFDKNCEAGGNIFSLCKQDPVDFSELTIAKGFSGLFLNCTTLTKAPDCSHIISVYEYGMRSAFRNTGLINSPDFSNLTTIGFGGMPGLFRGCTSLITAPNFNNVNALSGGGGQFQGAFYGCTSLISAPNFNSLTDIPGSALQECFYGCSSLINAPFLSNVVSISNHGLDSCFRDCSNLNSGPDFSNIITTSVNMDFAYCFRNCYKLSEVTAPNIQDWNTSTFYVWMQNAGRDVTGTKTMYCPAGTVIPTSNDGIPSGWTRVDY